MTSTMGEGGAYGALGCEGVSPRQRLAGSPLLPAFDAIEALLFAAGARHPDEPLVAGIVDGLRQQGAAVAAIGGPAAMASMLDLVSAGEAVRGRHRRAFVNAAWSGLEGWNP